MYDISVRCVCVCTRACNQCYCGKAVSTTECTCSLRYTACSAEIRGGWETELKVTWPPGWEFMVPGNFYKQKLQRQKHTLWLTNIHHRIWQVVVQSSRMLIN